MSVRRQPTRRSSAYEGCQELRGICVGLSFQEELAARSATEWSAVARGRGGFSMMT